MATTLVEVVTFIMGCDYQEGSWWLQEDEHFTFTATDDEDLVTGVMAAKAKTESTLMDLEASLPWCKEDDDFGLAINPRIVVEFHDDNTPTADLVVAESRIQEIWDSLHRETCEIPF